MKIYNRLKQFGFTLIELGLVIVVLGILAAVAVPKYIEIEANTLATAKKGMIGTVKSAFSMTITDLGRYPTFQELADNIQGGEAVATKGIEVDIDGTSYYVKLSTEVDCSNVNPALIVPTATVKCVQNTVTT